MAAKAFIILLFGAYLCGCTSPIGFRHVRLDPTVAQPGATGTTRLTAPDKDVQEALQIVEAVAIQNGLVRGRESEDATTLRMYGTTANSGELLHCYVRLKEGVLDVALADFKQKGSSPTAVRLQSEVKRRFIERFGQVRVK